MGLLQSCNQPDHNPNIIIILADDLGYGDVGVYGSTQLQTPNIDRMAEQGLRFTDGYCTSATCSPSRYGLLTGQYPWRNKRAHVLAGDAPLLVDPGKPTLPGMLQDAGYTTAVVGKWHLGLGEGSIDWNEPISPGPNEVGFDYSYIMAATNDRVPNVFVENGKVVRLDPDDPILVDYQENFNGEPTGKDHPEMLKMHPSHGHDMSINNGISRIGYQKGGKSAMWVDENMADTFLVRALDFIRSHKEGPFFLYYGLHQPHVPRVPHPRFAGTTGLGPRGDVIAEADWCVGEILDELEELQIQNHTLVIFSSDNGPVLDDGYQDQAVELIGSHTPRGGLRGGKYSLFDAGTHVPFMTWWPGTIEPGTSEALVCQLDLFASLTDLVGQPNGGPDSENILDALLGKKENGRDQLILQATGNRIAFRQNDWILIPPHAGRSYMPWVDIETGNDPEYQLYQISTDPGQQNNLAKEQPEKLQNMIHSFEQEQGTVWVSPEGRQNGSGSRKQPITLVSAIERAQQGQCNKIVLLDGKYSLEKPLLMENISDLMIQADNPGQVVFTSARPFLMKKDEMKGSHILYTIDLHRWRKEIPEWPDAFRGYQGWPEVYLNNQPLSLARWPDSGYARIEKVIDQGSIPRSDSSDQRGGIFTYSDNEPDNWDPDQTLYLGGYWCYKWYDELIRVEKISPAEKSIKLAAPHHYGIGGPSGGLFYALNIQEALDAPGEYCYNANSGTIRLILPEDPSSGDQQLDVQIAWKQFPLIRLEHCRDVTLKGIQISKHAGVGVAVEDGERIRIESCLLENISSAGVVITGGSHCGLSQCELNRIGMTAISLTGGDKQRLIPAGHYVEACHIHHFARHIKTYHPGVHLQGVGHRVVNNHIHDAPHNAILFGGNDHLIADNRIERVCWDTSDAGAIYCGRDWTLGGTVIRNNYFSDLGEAIHHHNWAIYLDDLASGITVTDNTIENCSSGILVGGGRYNVIAGNRMIGCSRASLLYDARGVGWYGPYLDDPDHTLWTRLKDVSYDQPPWSDRFPWLAEIENDDPAIPKHNIIRDNQLVNSVDMNLHPTVIEFRQKP